MEWIEKKGEKLPCERRVHEETEKDQWRFLCVRLTGGDSKGKTGTGMTKEVREWKTRIQEE